MKLRMKLRLRTHKKLTAAAIIVVLLGVALGVVFGTGLVMAGEDAFSQFRQALEAERLPVVTSILTQGAGGARLEITLQSRATDGQVLPEDKQYQHRVLRNAALAKGRGLTVDEVALRIVDAQGKVLLTLERPLEEAIVTDPSTAAVDSEALVASVRGTMAKDFPLPGVEVKDVSVRTTPDGAPLLAISMVAADPKAASESLAAFLSTFRWDLVALWAAEGRVAPAVIEVDVDDAAGKALVRYTADLQLQQDSGWFTPGMTPPGPQPFGPFVGSDVPTPASADGEGS